MLAKAHTFGIIGIDAYPVEIEVDVANGLPSISIVGLPDSAIKESKERIRSGIKNSEFQYPSDKITINLAPADIKKEGSAFDLAMALGILAATKQINKDILEEFYFVGELSLHGELRAVQGTLSMALCMRKKKIRKLIVPEANAREAAVVKEIKVFAVKTLRELIALLHNPEALIPYSPDLTNSNNPDSNIDLDLSDVKGQAAAKRALEIAACGRHNILFIGPPGSGKTMLAKRLNTILPDLTEEESLETTRIHSAMGLMDTKTGLMAQRPFRAPHHTISDIALVGGGSHPQPGEISLAHNGVLFLDELPEFHRDALEVLRQPLEDGHIRVARALRSLIFPARFMFIAAMNPCPCGGFGQPETACRCSINQVHRYRSKISGPLLDRIDIHMEVPSVKYQELAGDELGESSKLVKERVRQAHEVQKNRLKNEKILFNSLMSHKQTKKYCAHGPEAADLLKTAIEKFRLSSRAYDKILKIGRTIADLEGSENIKTAHLAEAIQYRSLDRRLWME